MNIFNHGDAETVDEIDDLGQLPLDLGLFTADAGDSQGAALPRVEVVDFGDRHIVFVSHPVLDAAENLPFPLEGVVFSENKVKRADSDEHGSERSGASAVPVDRLLRGSVPPGPE